MNDKDNTARIMNLADYNIGIKHNGELLISLGKSRFETAWKNKRILWSSLLARLSKSVETPETHAEYMKMSKEQQDRIKDIGGFVGGHLENERPAASWPARSSPSTWTSLLLTSGTRS